MKAAQLAAHGSIATWTGGVLLFTFVISIGVALAFGFDPGTEGLSPGSCAT
jgi:hypothetical protein